jgi:hypothetical protein
MKLPENIEGFIKAQNESGQHSICKLFYRKSHRFR